MAYMEVSIFIGYPGRYPFMVEGFIEQGEISNLAQQEKGGGVFDDINWRESYYFNVSDRRSGLTLLTTIGLLPNKKRSAGFVYLMRDWKTLLLKPVIKRGRPEFDGRELNLKGLEYRVDGCDWILEFDSDRISFSIRFKPLNRAYAYATEEADKAFERIGTQHYEQAGEFEGWIMVAGKKERFGPCFGHRDHSWGIRDWSSVDKYRLFCCTFSKDLAVNLWEGSMGGMEFLEGYVFDGERNSLVVRSKVKTEYGDNGLEPKSARIHIEDDEGREHLMKCKVVSCTPFPPKQSLLYETISEMNLNGVKGHGLLEYLYHFPNPVRRVPVYSYLIGKMMGVPGCW